jgi:hypothetical protein
VCVMHQQLLATPALPVAVNTIGCGMRELVQPSTASALLHCCCATMGPSLTQACSAASTHNAVISTAPLSPPHPTHLVCRLAPRVRRRRSCTLCWSSARPVWGVASWAQTTCMSCLAQRGQQQQQLAAREGEHWLSPGHRLRARLASLDLQMGCLCSLGASTGEPAQSTAKVQIAAMRMLHCAALRAVCWT